MPPPDAAATSSGRALPGSERGPPVIERGPRGSIRSGDGYNRSSMDESWEGRYQVRTKKCKDCGLHLALRHFKPSVKEPGGLFSICDGCNFRINTYRRLITKQKLTAAEAERECNLRFDELPRVCRLCKTRLPFTFFQGWQCRTCVRDYQAGYRLSRAARKVKRPRFKECTACQHVLPAAQFFSSKQDASGLLPRCKECMKRSGYQFRDRVLQVARPLQLLADTLRCWSCKVVKPRGMFYKNRGTTHGISYICKECFRERYGEKKKAP